MNRTLDKIPQAVLDSIANREFAFSRRCCENRPGDRGAGCKRVRGNVVGSSSSDEGSRCFRTGVSLYRYFLCQGDRGIETILRWMGSPPLVFDRLIRERLGNLT